VKREDAERTFVPYIVAIAVPSDNLENHHEQGSELSAGSKVGLISEVGDMDFICIYFYIIVYSKGL
jgi:hypothetical protein